jgi:DNA-binding GntR family transcriptional regulator
VGEPQERVVQPPTPPDWGEILLDEVMLASLSRQAVYLRESSLADKYRVGRSIIRQTFSRFAGAGLLEHIPRTGWLVHPFSEPDMEAYLEVRETLELKALDLATVNMNDSDLKYIRRWQCHALDNSIHRYLIETAGNRYIRDFFNQYVARFYTKLFHYAAPETSVVEEMTSQHQEIVDRLRVHDWAAAKAILADHIREQRSVLKKLLAGH